VDGKNGCETAIAGTGKTEAAAWHSLSDREDAVALDSYELQWSCAQERGG
jgi:hypothetical protein